MKTALVTFIYSNALAYVDPFAETLRSQSLQDFELVLFNDGVDQVNMEAVTGKLKPARTVNMDGTITEIRCKALDWLRDEQYEKIIFQDMDDAMSNNRVEQSVRLLDAFDLVCNDLSLMTEEGTVFRTNIWSGRLGSHMEFDHTFIEDKNIVGFGNTSIRRSILQFPVKCQKDVAVSDWFLFYQLMVNGRIQALFTSECQTLYRQHEANTAGVREETKERREYIKKIKAGHYKALEESGFHLSADLLLEETPLKETNKISDRTNFWWE